MKIREAKDNIIKNFRANYTNDYQSIHDIEVFLLNTLEQFESVVTLEARIETLKECLPHGKDIYCKDEFMKGNIYGFNLCIHETISNAKEKYNIELK